MGSVSIPSIPIVHSEILLPPQAPKEYVDRSVLWNAVERVETHARAQLARTYNVSLPNEWSHELAKEVMRDYIRRNFVDKGMCAEFAIHDSVNSKTHQMNLHCHIMLTMRPILEDGSWGDKQKKVYKYDRDGNKIRKKNGRYDCVSVKTTDWDEPDNARRWRKNLADTINEVNQRIGNTDIFWEHRSYKERKLEIKPTIHLGEKSAALERQGIQTERGDYNREVRYYNSIVERMRVIRAEELRSQRAKRQTDQKPKIRNEILAFLEQMRTGKGVMTLPIVSSRYLGKISNRQALQNPDTAEALIQNCGLETFEQLEEYYRSRTERTEQMETRIRSERMRADKLTSILEAHQEFARYRKIKKESDSLSGLAKWKYDREHKAELSEYPAKKKALYDLLQKGAKLTPKAWERELGEIRSRLSGLETDYARSVRALAIVEVIRHSKRDEERIMQNEGQRVTQRQPKRRARDVMLD